MHFTLVCMLAGLLCAVTVAAAPVGLSPSFDEFVHKYGKYYYTAEERARRLSIFEHNLELIKERNAKQVAAGFEPVHGVTMFSDLTQGEFAAYANGFIRPKQRHYPDSIGYVATAKSPDAPVPSKIDWRLKNVITPVKDQGECGSCWAFSVTEEVESNWIQAGNAMVALSVQQLVACDKGDNGCNGGDTEVAFTYVMSAGFETNATFPYTSGPSDDDAGPCLYNASEVLVHVSNYSYGTVNHSEPLLMASVANIGPMSACVATGGWDSYTSGILSVGCGGEADVGHCVQIVGYTNDATLGRYWIVRNSWTTEWGINGYIYLSLGNNTCDITGYTTYGHIRQ